MEAAKQKSRREVPINIASSGAAICTGTVVFNWLDVLRIRWQVAPAGSAGGGLLGFFGTIVRTEGLINGLWRQGLAANVLACGSSYALRVGTYPLVRDALVLTLHGDGGSKATSTMFAAGFASGMMGFFLSAPIWQIKTRIHAEAGQLDAATGRFTTGAAAGRAPYFGGVGSGLARLWREGGVRHLWHGASPLVARGALLSGGTQLGYDGTKTLAKRHGLLAEGVGLHVVSSVAAAFWSATFAAPFDILLTKFQGGRPDGARWGSLRQCASAMVAEGGLGVFFRGWTPFFGRIAPLNLLTLPLYEQIRRRVFGLGYLD